MRNIKIVRTEHSLPNEIHKAFLDSPTTTPFKEHQNNTVLVAGWYITDNETTSIVIVHSDGREEKFTRNAQRPDVLNKVLGITDPGKEDSLVGFNLPIENIESDFTIHIEIEQKRYLWIEVLITNSLPSSSIEKFWTEYHSTHEPKTIAAPSPQELINTLSQTVKHFHFNNQDIKKYLTNEQHHIFKKFLDKVFSGEFTAELASSSESGKVSSPFSRDHAIICHSFLREHTNHLQITSEDQLLYIVQKISSADAIYLPSKNLFITIAGATDNDFQPLIEGILDLIKEKPKAKSVFSGFHVGFPRPYHFMYDLLPGFNLCYNLGLISKNTKTYASPCGGFLNIGQLYNLDYSTETANWRELNSKMHKSGGYLIKLGIYFAKGIRKLGLISNIINLDQKLVSLSEKAVHPTSQHIDLITNCHPIIWIGVTGQKRSWLEQTTGIAFIINSLKKQHPNLGVIFDGWTRSLDDNPLDQRESTADESIITSIKTLTNPETKIASLIGATLIEKIYTAMKIDFFITNGLTGSMNVARVCKKPGVIHMSTATYNTSQTEHIHRNSRYLNASHVTDVPDETNPRPDFVSYSTSPIDLLELIEKSLSEALTQKNNNLSENWRTTLQS